jgi:hypothetical protein
LLKNEQEGGTSAKYLTGWLPANRSTLSAYEKLHRTISHNSAS